MSATENSIIPSVMEENASSSCTGQTKRNSTSTKNKEKKTVTDEAKIRHNEIERSVSSFYFQLV
jgi:hypothetical protein